MDIKKRWLSICCGIAVVAAFLLPLKFGSIAAIPEIPLLFPDQFVFWLLITWPTMFFPALAGLLLLGLCVVMPGKVKLNYGLIIALLWALLAVLSMLGIAPASTRDFAYLQVTHLYGIAAFAIAAVLVVQLRPDTKKWFIVAIVIAALITCFWGLHQAFAGFEETRQFVYKQELESGVAHSSKFLKRLHENRVFSTFSLSNSYAAHLVLVIPLCVWLAWTVAGLIEPPKVSRALIVPLVTAVLLVTLWYTISRAAVLSLGLAVMLSFWVLPFPRKIAAVLTLGGGLCTVIGYFTVNVGRSIASLKFRFDYFRVAFELFLNNIWTGDGWGDFFHAYTRMKLLNNDEAPHTPHNMLLAFASQSGIGSVVVAVLVIVIPVIIVCYWQRQRYKRFAGDAGHKRTMINLSEDIRTPVFIGWLAWSIHAMLDINIQIPGTVATALLMLFIVLPDYSPCRRRRVVARWVLLPVCFIIAAISLVGSYRLVAAEHSYYQLHTYCDPRFKKPGEFAKTTVYQMQRLLRECEQLMPYSPFPYTTASDFAMYKRMPNLAEEYMQKAIKKSPERASFYWKLGILQLINHKHDEALKNFKKAKELFPRNPKYSRLPTPADFQRR